MRTKNVYEQDFQWRGDLWKKVHADEDEFWQGEIIKLPDDDWHEFRGKQYGRDHDVVPLLPEIWNSDWDQALTGSN